MPAPFIVKDEKSGNILDVRRVVEGTGGYEGKDEFEFCFGKESSLDENLRTFRVKVSEEDAERLVRYLNKHLHPIDKMYPTLGNI